MLFKRPGTISSLLNKKIIIFLILQAAVVVFAAGYHSWSKSSAECIRCHADPQKLAELGRPEFLVTPQMVVEQSKHSTAQCRDCHLGNGRAKDKDKAHRGMLKMLVVGEEAELKPRDVFYPTALNPTGKNRLFELIPKRKTAGEYRYVYEVRTLLWHDRDPDTYNFDPQLARKTCGKPDCHPDQVKQFETTIMATNLRQRTMKTWLVPYGPHNCGPSFADLPPREILTAAGFDYRNTANIRNNLNMQFSDHQAEDKQRICNTCHTGCLDCHFTPMENQPHRFTKVPPSESCSGFGRGSMCHSGSMESRRGETYIGGDYAIPPGMQPDIHYSKGIHCVQCHPTGIKGMGDMQRKADCQDCHLSIEKAHAQGIHKNLTCAACHVNALGGYQVTVWGPGWFADKKNPFYKYALYYGVQKPPVLIQDQQGMWMPVKIMPHAVGNIKSRVPPSPGLQFRWPQGETQDAYFIVGTYDSLPENNNHLLWLEIQRASHPYGKSRSCESCHQNRQISKSTWEFLEGQGAEATFTGEHEIVADQDALFIQNLRNTSPIVPFEDYRLSDFASWLYLKDKWRMEGDFRIKTDRTKYRTHLEKFEILAQKLQQLDQRSKDFDKKASLLYRSAKGTVLHHLDSERAKSSLENFLSDYSD